MADLAPEEPVVEDVDPAEAALEEEAEMAIEALFDEKPAETAEPSGEARPKTEAEIAKEKLKADMAAAEVARITKSVLTGVVDGNVNKTTTSWFVWLVGTVLVYAIAALGLHFLFVVLTVPFVIFLRQLAIRRMARRSLQYATVAALRRHLPDHESVEWINNLFATVWTNYRKYLEAEVKSKAAVKLNESLPKQVKRLDLETFSMGDYPPRLEDFKVFKHNQKQLVLDATFFWDSTLQVAVAAHPAMGGGKLPPARFSVRDLFLCVRVRLTVDLVQNVYPFARRAAMQLTEAPQVDVGVSALGVRLLELPGVDWVKRLVIKNVCEVLCHPSRLEVDVLRLLGINEADVLERERTAKEKVSRLKGAANTAGRLISGTVGVAADLGMAALKGGGKAVVAVGGGALKAGTALGGGALKAGTALGGGALKAGTALGGGALKAGTALGGGALNAGTALGGGALNAGTALGGGALKGAAALSGGAMKGATALGGGAMKGATALGGGAMKGAGVMGSVGMGALSGAAHLTGSGVRNLGKMGMTMKKVPLAPEEEKELAEFANALDEEDEGKEVEGGQPRASSQELTQAVGAANGSRSREKGGAAAEEASGGEQGSGAPAGVHKRKKSLLQKLF